MSLPPITITIDPPLPSDSPQTFNQKAFGAWASLALLTPQLVSWGNGVSDIATTINQHKSDAANAATTATNKASEATTAATTATTKAGEATTAATTATGAANTATTKASEAGTAATTATGAATSAAQSKDAAETAATTATGAKTAAEAAAAAAGDSETAAETAAATATTKAGEASASASTAASAETAAVAAAGTATTKAGEASTSASAAADSQAAAAASAAAAADAAEQAAGGGEPTILPGTTAQYWRGDKTWQPLNKQAVGLGSVDNTPDADKPISTATQTALNGKADTGHTHPAATTSAAGLMSAADKTKLNGIATGATKNATDAHLLNRANHTGTQPISTVEGLQAALDAASAGGGSSPTSGPSEITVSRGTDGSVSSVGFVLESKAGSITLTRTSGLISSVATAYDGKTRTETIHRNADGSIASVTATEA